MVSAGITLRGSYKSKILHYNNISIDIEATSNVGGQSFNTGRNPGIETGAGSYSELMHELEKEQEDSLINAVSTKHDTQPIKISITNNNTETYSELTGYLKRSTQERMHETDMELEDGLKALSAKQNTRTTSTLIINNNWKNKVSKKKNNSDTLDINNVGQRGPFTIDSVDEQKNIELTGYLMRSTQEINELKQEACDAEHEYKMLHKAYESLERENDDLRSQKDDLSIQLRSKEMQKQISVLFRWRNK